MRLIERRDIDTVRWNQLVEATNDATIFNYAYYLDTVAENWCVYVDDDYSCGIAVPYTIRLGVKSCYTPIFLRYVEWLGQQPDSFEEFKMELEDNFTRGNYCVRNLMKDFVHEKYVFQEWHPEIKKSTQLKRMLKKFHAAQFLIHEQGSNDLIFHYIRSELPAKISTINQFTIDRLHALVEQLEKEEQLFKYLVYNENTCVGGLFFMETNTRLVYLKGAFLPQSKKDGAMYGAMDLAIQYAQKKSLIFDFGGSRVENVRKFNYNMSGEDRKYYEYRWDKTPLWFKGLRSMKMIWKKR